MEEELQWKETFVLEELQWNITFNERRPSVEENSMREVLGIGPSMDKDLQWTKTFNGQRPSIKEDIQCKKKEETIEK